MDRYDASPLDIAHLIPPEELHDVIALIGPSKSGKSTITKALLDRYPERLRSLKSLTTREKRPPEDLQSKEEDIIYDFIDRETFAALRTVGRLMQEAEYVGNLYGNDWAHLQDVLSNAVGLTSLVEQSVRNFRAARLKVHVIRITPVRADDARTPERRAADAVRASLLEPHEIDLEVENRHEPGGLEIAVGKIARYIEPLLPPPQRQSESVRED